MLVLKITDFSHPSFITYRKPLHPPNPPTQHPQLKKPEPTKYLSKNIPKPQCLPTLDLLDCFPFTHFTLTQKNSYKCAYRFFHNTLTIKLLKTINEMTLANTPCFSHFHGPHITISPNHYHSHYIITKKTMNFVTLDYIT